MEKGQHNAAIFLPSDLTAAKPLTLLLCGCVVVHNRPLKSEKVKNNLSRKYTL